MKEEADTIEHAVHQPGNAHDATGTFNQLNLLQAFEKAIDEHIISTTTDTEGVIIHANRKFCEVSKFREDEVIGQKHSIVNSGFHAKEFFKGLWRTIGAGHVWQGEIRNKAKDGSFYWVDTVIVPVKDNDGINTHYLSLRTLITERKDAEKRKQQYVNSLEVLLVMTSNNIQKPLAECLRQLAAFDADHVSQRKELRDIVMNLTLSAKELDHFRKEFTSFIREMGT